MWSGCGVYICVFFQAEDGIRDLVRSRGLGDVYKRQTELIVGLAIKDLLDCKARLRKVNLTARDFDRSQRCLLYTSDAADERSSVDLGGRRIIKKKKHTQLAGVLRDNKNSYNQEILTYHGTASSREIRRDS